MPLSGVWINDYGSVMAIRHHPDGRLTGDYASTTGSTGRYRLCGRADLGPRAPGAGLAAALSILWRPCDQGEPDAVWHWASALAGQTFDAGDGEGLSLMHALVGTTPFADFGPPATFIDKLIYRRAADRADIPPPPPADEGSCDADRLAGAWRCAEDAAVTVRFGAGGAGRLIAAIDWRGSPVTAEGFTDPDADGLALQSLTLTAPLPDGRLLALAGRAARDPDEITATAMISRGLASDERYAGVTLSTWTLRRI